MSSSGKKGSDDFDRDVDFSQLDHGSLKRADAVEHVTPQEAAKPRDERAVSESVVSGEELQVETAPEEAPERDGIAREQDIEFLTRELERVEDELADYKDKYMRALADAENIRKRATKERSELLKYQGEKLVIDLLDVVDNLERAVATPGSDFSRFLEGVEMIQRRFVDILGKWEIRGVSGIGQNFDPEKHAAISKVPVDDAVPGTIINELKKAYFYKDKLLRPAEVVVVAERSAPESYDDDEDTSADDDNSEETVT